MTRTSIIDEIKQSRPFASRSQEATVALLRTAHLLRRRLDEVVAAEGITSQQYNVLRILRGSRAPLPTMEIAARMIEPGCGITRLIGTLEESGYVRREQWAGDRRQVLCQITPEGLRLLERLDAPMSALDASIGHVLTPEQTEELLDILSVLRHGLQP